jgi:3-deoxy-manno-octulosonate cytidylyltransferase (CMP-KDO synthetase)
MRADFRVVIPARYGSTRLPGKPLRNLAGKPMIRHVYERGLDSRAQTVIVATDDERIQRAVEAFGGRACLTSPEHSSGSDRVCEVVERMAWREDEIVVNLQGDEPAMPGALVRQVAEALAAREDLGMATLCEPMEDARDVLNVHVVKVVTDAQGLALYFSRAPIPADPSFDESQADHIPTAVGCRRHIGLYAYRVGFLKRFVGWPACALERRERLEQLRVLWNGERILVIEAQQRAGHGVDTEQDLERASALLQTQPGL